MDDLRLVNVRTYIEIQETITRETQNYNSSLKWNSVP